MNTRPSHLSVRQLCLAAAVAAVYAVLTLTLPVPAFGPIQLRFAEAMTVLPFLFPETIPGLAVGCFLSNLLGSPYVLDWVFGTLATLLAALCTARIRCKWLAPLPPVLFNAVIVGGEIAFSMTGATAAMLPAWLYNGATVGLGELLVCYVLGLILLQALPRIPYFRDMIPEARRAALHI